MGNEQGSSAKGLGLLEQSEKNSYEELKDGISKTCKCSWKTRIIGYVVCFIIGWILSIFSSIIFLFKHDYIVFAIMYSIGTILNISGSCFLATPKTQFKDMTKKTRIWLSIAYLGSTIATIVLAILLPDNLKILVIITLIIQVISYFLYTLSFIPFGRTLLKKFCQCLLF